MSNLSFVRHIGDGVNTQFALAVSGENIGYFRTSDIKSYVDDVEVPFTIQVASPHIVIFTTAPPVGSDVLIRREMPVKLPYANFERGNNFGHTQVNNTFLQQLYITQELLDGFLPTGFYMKQDVNMGSHHLKGIRDGEDPQDAISKNQLDTYSTDMLAYQEVQDSRILDLEQSVLTGNLIYRRVTFTATEGQFEFNPNATFSAVLALYINGVNQIAGEAYEIIDGRLIRTVPLSYGDRVSVVIGQEPVFTEPTQSDFRYVRYPITALGGETLFTLPISFKQVISLYINGIHQTYLSAFSYDTATRTISLAEALSLGDEVVAVLGNEVEEFIGFTKAEMDIAISEATAPLYAAISALDLRITALEP